MTPPAPSAPPASVRASVTVAVGPERAFQAFTGEIDQWYRRGVATMGRGRGATTLRIEPGVGGRVLEVLADAEERERGRVLVWEPGTRLVFVDWRGTEVEVGFEAVPGGTRVVLEHRGLDRLPPGKARDVARFGWRRLATWFEAHLGRRPAIHSPVIEEET